MIIDTQDYNVLLNIDDDISVIFKFVGDADTHLLNEAISNLTIHNDTAVVLLWAAAGRFYNQSECVTLLNTFYRSIKNPVVLFSGALNVQSAELDFIHQPINLFRYIAKLEQPVERKVKLFKSKKFLFLSTKDYLSRRYILQHLINNNYADQGVISYRCLNDSRSLEGYLDVPNIQLACMSIDHLLPYGGLDGESDDTIFHQHKPESAISNTYLGIITETYYNGPIFLSEKVFYAMLYNQFFIFSGPAHSLKHLRSMGFKTFSHIIDESYDDIEDPIQRLCAVVKSLDEFIKKPLDEIARLYKENIDIINQNRQLVLQTEINKLVNDTLRQAICRRLNNT